MLIWLNIKENSIQRMKLIKCAYCSASFVTNAELAEHQSRKCHSKHFKCTYCNANFAVYKFLADHQRKCHPKEPFKCTYCNAIYPKSEELIEHVSHIHQFKCGLCPTFFGDFIKFCPADPTTNTSKMWEARFSFPVKLQGFQHQTFDGKG